MNILTIPLRSSRRKWLRTLLLATVFTLGVSSIVALHQVSKVVGHSLEEKLTAFGANILVSPRTDTLRVSYGGMNLGDMLVDVRHLDETNVRQRIAGIENAANVAAVAPKLVIMRELGGMPLGVVGVRFADERGVKGYWAVNGDYPDGPGQVLLGSAVADRLGLGAGDSLASVGMDAVATGVLHPTGGDDDNVVLADLGWVQDMAGLPGAVSFVEVAALCAGCPIEEITTQIAAAMPDVEVKALKSVVQSRMYSVNFVQRLILAVSVIILLTACSMIGLSMLSAVNERRREIGVLRSLGYSRAGIFGIFCFEALAVGVVSGLAGYAAGHLASFKVIAALDVAGTAAPAFSAGQLLLTCLMVAALSALASALPAYKAARIEPSEALVSL